MEEIWKKKKKTNLEKKGIISKLVKNYVIFLSTKPKLVYRF